MDIPLKIMIVAGEASGDNHAARLVSEMRALAPDRKLEFFGSAGPRMLHAGVESVIRSDDLSIVGLLEIGRALPMFLNAFKRLKKAARARKPDVVILVDFPDFNLKLAKQLKKSGFKIVYYISPQLWAWRKYRLRTVKKFVDLVLTILPFEKQWYADNGFANVEYVGSPLTREIHPNTTKDDFCARYHVDPDRPIVSLLPGSRHKEIAKILPGMLEAASLMQRANPSIQFLAAMAPGKGIGELEAAVLALRRSEYEIPANVSVIEGETYDALNASDAAAITSGTATLEAGIIGTPMAIVYKTSAINYALLRPLISVEHFGLVNLIAGKRIAVEMIQGDFTARALASELLRLIEPEANSLSRQDLADAAERLGHGGASKRAAQFVLDMIGHDIRQE